MKRLLRLLLLPSLALWLVPGRGAQAQPVVVHGHFDHAPAGDTVWLEYRGHLGRAALSTRLSATGDFTLVVPNLNAPAPASIYCASQRASLYLSPGDDLGLRLDFPQFRKTQRYTGRGAAANNYLAQSLWEFEYSRPDGSPDNVDVLYCTTMNTPAETRQRTDAFRRKKLDFLATYEREHPLTPAFRREALAHIDLRWAVGLLAYAVQVPRVARTRQQLAVISDAGPAGVLPADYFDFLAQLPPHTYEPPSDSVDRGPDDTPLLQRFMDAYANNLVPGGARSPEPATPERVVAQATADLGAGRARAYALGVLLFEKQLRLDPAWVVTAYPAFRAYNRDSTTARFMRRTIASQRQVEPGRLAPPFRLLDAAGKVVALSDFKGKVVYLDFWGTWCSPCRQEMPASTALRRRFAGREVVFVYISMRDKESAWRQALRQYDLADGTAVHLRALDEALLTEYQITEFPRHVLIGRRGQLLAPKAPPPTDPATVAAIETALRE